MTSPVRSRQQTRAALLTHLLIVGDSYRSELVQGLKLTEASISRIVAELKSEGLISEYARRPAPYPGGPTNVVAINRSLMVAGVEISNGRVSVGIGSLGGELAFSERNALTAHADANEVERVIARSAQAAVDWARSRVVDVRQVAISLPGFGAFGEINTIVPGDADTLRGLVQKRFADVPVVVTNSVQAQASLHGFGADVGSFDREHLFLFVGHGVGAVRIGHLARGTQHQPVEIGHMVLDRAGPVCRCGHHGCLEAYVALPAVAALLGITEAELLAQGDAAFATLPMTEIVRNGIESMLGRLGLALGNAINIAPTNRVVVAGWPSLVPVATRQVMLDALDSSVLGGSLRRGIEVTFIAPSIGNDPLPAIAYAAHSYAQRGAATRSAAEAH